MIGRDALRHGVGPALLAAVLVYAGGADASPAMDAAASRAIAAGAPSKQVGAIVRRASQRMVRTDSVVAGLRQLETAARAGLPTGPVADKVLEGLTKRIPAESLASAAKEVTGRLTTARTALGALGSKGRLVEEAAEALRRGASPEAVEALAEAARGAPAGAVEPTLRELAELGERGAADALAGAALGTLASRGYPAAAIDSISGQLDKLLAEGGAPVELLGELRLRAHAGRPIDRLVDPFGTGGSVIRDRRARLDSLAASDGSLPVKAGAVGNAGGAPLQAGPPAIGTGAAALVVSPLDQAGAGAADAVVEEAGKSGRRKGDKKKK